MAKNTKLDLEETFSLLEATIDRLESEQVPLQESLTAFEQGIKLARQAQKALAEAEQKVRVLIDGDDQPEIREFSEDVSK
jgi:exodeoxyribonuclease VII small subunit